MEEAPDVAVRVAATDASRSAPAARVHRVVVGAGSAANRFAQSPGEPWKRLSYAAVNKRCAKFGSWPGNNL